MRDKLIDFIENHRVLCFFIIFVVVVAVILCSMRAYNKKRMGNNFGKSREEIEAQNTADTGGETVASPTPTQKSTTEYRSEVGGQKGNEDYNSELSIKARERRKETEMAQARLDEYEKRKAKEEEEKRVKEARKHMKPTYGDAVLCWDTDGVPDTMVDGSSCKAYLSSVSLSDFGSMWGKKLTMNDKLTTEFYMVGVNQNKDDYVTARDCQSVGWLISNFKTIGKNAAIKFTDLNLIGSLSDDHVVVLCSYDWYSAYGMQDTLVVFEDISGTLKRSDFKSGTIFSAMCYKHNIKLESVNGQTVVCIQYNTFK